MRAIDPLGMDCFEPRDRTQLAAIKESDPLCARVLEQLDRIFASGLFARVRQEARSLLIFVVGKKLIGCEADIKETTIAVHVFGRPADYDCSQSATVRVAAASVRQRLIDYYKSEGHEDAIEIAIPTGTYVPEIRDRLITIAVSRFDNWNPKNDQDHLCATASDEIAHRLNLYDSVEARRVPALEGTNHGTRYGLRGSLACRGELLTLNVSVSDLESGEIISCEAMESPRDELLKLSREVADGIIAVLRAQIREPRESHVVATSRSRNAKIRSARP